MLPKPLIPRTRAECADTRLGQADPLLQQPIRFTLWSFVRNLHGFGVSHRIHAVCTVLTTMRHCQLSLNYERPRKFVNFNFGPLTQYHITNVKSLAKCASLILTQTNPPDPIRLPRHAVPSRLSVETIFLPSPAQMCPALR